MVRSTSGWSPYVRNRTAQLDKIVRAQPQARVDEDFRERPAG
jgi:hypothetical protein